MSSLRQTVGRNVRLARVARGWSQEVLAELAGMHRSYICSVERAQRNISLANLERIAAALGVSAASLLGEHPLQSWFRAQEARPAYRRLRAA